MGLVGSLVTSICSRKFTSLDCPHDRGNGQMSILAERFENIDRQGHCNILLNKPKFKGSRQKIVILTTISSYLFIVSLLVACNHDIDLFIFGHFGSLMAKYH